MRCCSLCLFAVLPILIILTCRFYNNFIFNLNSVVVFQPEKLKLKIMLGRLKLFYLNLYVRK